MTTDHEHTTTTGCGRDGTLGDFVRVDGMRFLVGGRTHRFVGINFWQGMNLGVDGPGGDRGRLHRELDRLQRLGVTNLRVTAAAEGPDTEPLRMKPALMTAPGEYNETVFDGLDYLLDQLGRRGMRAVVMLGNFWHWSGGFAQYVSWLDGSEIPYPGDWDEFQEYAARFYQLEQCQAWYRDHIATVIGRDNRYSGRAYRDDPTVFAWELANEPRHFPPSWIDDTAAFIKSLDANHLVTTGVEGYAPNSGVSFVEAHDGPDIDYATIHIWPQNWGWFCPWQAAGYEKAKATALDYFDRHAALTAELDMPLVLEAFGLARDAAPYGDVHDPRSPVSRRNLFFKGMYDAVYKSAVSGGPLAGDNLWAWGGEARPGHGWTGDPPDEPPGWYSVYDTDTSTVEVLAIHAEEMAALD